MREHAPGFGNERTDLAKERLPFDIGVGNDEDMPYSDLGKVAPALDNSDWPGIVSTRCGRACQICDGSSILGPLSQCGFDHHFLSIADQGQLDPLPNLGLGVKVHCQIAARLELLLVDRD